MQGGVLDVRSVARTAAITVAFVLLTMLARAHFMRSVRSRYVHERLEGRPTFGALASLGEDQARVAIAARDGPEEGRDEREELDRPQVALGTIAPRVPDGQESGEEHDPEEDELCHVWILTTPLVER